VLKSPYNPDGQIYEHLVQCSDLSIPPKELPSMYLLTSQPVRHQGQRETCSAFTGASIAEHHYPFNGRLSPEFIYYHLTTSCRMYGRNVFQILQKKRHSHLSYGTNEHPSAEVYHSARGRRLSGFSRIHTIYGAKHALVENGRVFIALPLYNNGPAFWKSDSSYSDQARDFHAVAIEGYDTNGFFFRNSWGPDWGNNGCSYLPFSDWNRVIEAWVGVSRRVSDFCQPGPQGGLLRWSIYGNARRTSVAGSVVPSTEVTAVERVR